MLIKSVLANDDDDDDDGRPQLQSTSIVGAHDYSTASLNWLQLDQAQSGPNYDDEDANQDE